MRYKKTLAQWIRWYHEAEKKRLEREPERSAARASAEAEELFTVIVPGGAPATDIGDDLLALDGVRWDFEVALVPGPDTVQ